MLFPPNEVIAVILAGGYGTRIKHLLNGVPKPMVSIAGRPFVEWVVRYLKTQGITKAIISTGYLAEVIEQHFQTHPVDGIQIICCRENTPLGTAGGFLNAVHHSEDVPNIWLVVNGDSLVFANLALLSNHFYDKKNSGVIVGLSVNDASRYGSLVCNQFGELENFAEKCTGAGIISVGVYLLKNSLLQEFPDTLPLSFENEVFPLFLSKHFSIQVAITDAAFLDIGTPESLAQAESFILQNLDKFESAY
ncbi:sugar phosphate nucleotidyltransferase [Anabaena sp. UHCC 0399]|uniref:sugar phosphate nucleotidyltransferase n=1 Tax=Anabaena sp. UHCC 0399 TaxID=3110238 RepID=UPI002B20C871|nr:sugar phosphate nucleotidyltransferase [Anabaena sp. UHCC 0399]MEA5567849.1 sugar phosphate nucleotidyltransferase [Anabaena sp. UHCC 0399]